MEPPELGQQMAEMAERLKRVRALQEQIAEAARQIQEVLLFDGHPELTELDDELDILYRGQL